MEKLVESEDIEKDEDREENPVDKGWWIAGTARAPEIKTDRQPRRDAGDTAENKGGPIGFLTGGECDRTDLW